ncbi:MAG TPA: GAF domain-containing sensor histidine kinase, partial [Solirubrobacterales bacterium]
MPVERGGRGWRDWPLLFQPRALEHGWRAAAFTLLCALSLTLIAYGDRLVGPNVSVGGFEAIPVIAAGWLLSDPLVLLIALAAVVARIVAVTIGGTSPITGVVQVAVIPFMAVVARTAAVAVVAARDAAERDGAISRIARIASSAASLEEILERVLKELAGSGLRGGAIALIDEQNNLYIAAAGGHLDAEVRNARLPVGQGVMGRAAAEQRPIVVADLDGPESPPSPIRSLGSNAEIRSMVAVPLLAAGRAIGVLEADSDHPHRFSDSDVAFLEQVSVAISGAVQRAGALRLADERLQLRVRELSILLDAARGLASSLDPDDIVATVCRSAAEIVLRSASGGRRASVIRIANGEALLLGDYDEAGGESQARYAFPIEDNPAGAAAFGSATQAAVHVDQLQGDLRERAKRLGIVSAGYAPIRVGREPWGVLSVSTREHHEFGPDELRLLQGIADLTGLAIANSELLQVERLRGEQLREHGDRMAGLEHVKSEFLRLASHELRGPLGVLNGYVSMLGDGSFGGLPAALVRIVPIMQGKVNEINLLIDQMLETARLEDSRLQLLREAVDLRAIVEAAVQPLQATAGEAHSIRVVLPPAPVAVLVDRARLFTILNNLLDNAIKYSPGGGEVEVSLEADGHAAYLAVADSGLGIAPADMQRLFTRFGRV